MALQHGIKAKRHSQAKPPKLTVRNRVVSFVAFVFLALASVALVGATLLLPAWSEQLVIQHEKDTLEARNADLRARLVAGERMIDGIRTDPVLIGRLAESGREFAPANQQVIGPADGMPLTPPDMVNYPIAERPAPPPAWVLRAGEKLQRPRTQRGFLVLAGGILLTAAFMFTPGHPTRSKRSRSRA